MTERKVYLDPFEYEMAMYRRWTAPMPKLERDAIKSWQHSLRADITRLLGGFPEPCELDPIAEDRRDLATHTRETLIYRSRENLDVFSFFLRPVSAPPRNATIICLPGHGVGVYGIVGLNPDGTRNTAPPEELYERGFALQCVNRGYNVLAIEQLGFGRRRHRVAIDEGPGACSCNPVAPALLLMNQTMIGHRVYDVIRGIDYLATRDDVDISRIGCMGISGGGTATLFASALDTRIKAAVVSGYLNTFKDSIMSINHCVDNYVPGILGFAEMYHLAGLVAPRALFSESGTRDSIFPIEATKASVAKARQIYEALGAPDMIGLEVFEGEHMFHGVGAFEFLSKVL